jgi:hypothetical protein
MTYIELCDSPSKEAFPFLLIYVCGIETVEQMHAEYQSVLLEEGTTDILNHVTAKENKRKEMKETHLRNHFPQIASLKRTEDVLDKEMGDTHRRTRWDNIAILA